MYEDATTLGRTGRSGADDAGDGEGGEETQEEVSAGGARRDILTQVVGTACALHSASVTGRGAGSKRRRARTGVTEVMAMDDSSSEHARTPCGAVFIFGDRVDTTGVFHQHALTNMQT